MSRGRYNSLGGGIDFTPLNYLILILGGTGSIVALSAFLKLIVALSDKFALFMRVLRDGNLRRGGGSKNGPRGDNAQFRHKNPEIKYIFDFTVTFTCLICQEFLIT